MSGNTGQQKDLFDELDKLVEKSKNWQCELLFNESLPDSEQSNFVDLATFLEGKTFVAELIIFSGHMDFKVASWENGNITWHTNLEEG